MKNLLEEMFCPKTILCKFNSFFSFFYYKTYLTNLAFFLLVICHFSMKKKNPSFFTSNTGTWGEDFFGQLHSEKPGLYILIIVYIYISFWENCTLKNNHNGRKNKFFGQLHYRKLLLKAYKLFFFPTALWKILLKAYKLVFVGQLHSEKCYS